MRQRLFAPSSGSQPGAAQFDFCDLVEQREAEDAVRRNDTVFNDAAQLGDALDALDHLDGNTYA